MTYDYMRNGTTTLFAAVNILDSTAVGRSMQRHRHKKVICFLNAVEQGLPASKLTHAVVGNYATHKYPKVSAWLARYPCWTFHSASTSEP